MSGVTAKRCPNVCPDSSRKQCELVKDHEGPCKVAIGEHCSLQWNHELMRSFVGGTTETDT